jgi:hypothetical protein
MITYVVWVLVLTGAGYAREPGYAVVDNIASRENCQALASALRVKGVGYETAACIAVRKVAPPAAH